MLGAPLILKEFPETSNVKEELLECILERMQCPVRRLIISGLHIHIGVESGEEAIAITNGMTRYIPLLIGLSANSPYFGSELIGLASTRTKYLKGCQLLDCLHF